MANQGNEFSEAEKSAYRAADKWGDAVMAKGFTVLPNLLLSHQQALGLSSLHCMLLIHLISYWWQSDRNPYPSKHTLAQRMGISERQVQRYISELIKLGFVRRQLEDKRGKRGRSIVSFDLAALASKLQNLELSSREIRSKKDILSNREDNIDI